MIFSCTINPIPQRHLKMKFMLLYTYVFGLLALLTLGQDISENDVISQLSAATGISPADITDRASMVDNMKIWARDKTWATFSKSSDWKQKYENNPTPERLLRISKSDLVNPDGQSSGGTTEKDQGPYKEAALNAYKHGRDIDAALSLQGKLQTDRGPNWKGYPDRFRPPEGEYMPNHAETKLIGDAAFRGAFPRSGSTIIAISRETCDRCESWMAAASVHHDKKIITVSPRKTETVGAQCNPQAVLLIQPFQYRLYTPDGKMVVYSKKYLSVDSPFVRTERNVIEDLRQQVAAENQAQQAQRFSQELHHLPPSLLRQGETCTFDPDLNTGPERKCESLTSLQLMPETNIGCPTGTTGTGIHGTWNRLKNGQTYISSLGLYCDGKEEDNAKGEATGTGFNIECGKNEALAGLHARIGNLVNAVGIICQDLGNGKQSESTLVPPIGGSSPARKTCEKGAAVYQLLYRYNLELGAHDGIGICCE